MCRAEVSSELVQSVASNKDTGRIVQHAVFSMEVRSDVTVLPMLETTFSSCAKVRSCFEFASDLRDVAALKARARKFVL